LPRTYAARSGRRRQGDQRGNDGDQPSSGNPQRMRDSNGATLPINRIVLYARNVEKTIRFYERHFGFQASRKAGDRIIELISRDGGVNLMIHQAAKGQAGGQSLMKLVFDVADVKTG
jgi:predicted enzyme related to lactoylglutathione lyase